MPKMFAVGPTNIILTVDGVTIATAQSIITRIAKNRIPLHGLGSIDPIDFGDSAYVVYGRLVNAVIEDSLFKKIVDARYNDKKRFEVVRLSDPIVGETVKFSDFPYLKDGNSKFENTIRQLWDIEAVQTNFSNDTPIDWNTYLPLGLDEFPALDIMLIGMPEAGAITGDDANRGYNVQAYKMTIRDVRFSTIRMDIAAGSPVISETIDFVARSIDSWKPIFSEPASL